MRLFFYKEDKMKLKNKNRFLIITLIMFMALLFPIFGCKNSAPTEDTKTTHENVGEKEKTDSKNADETNSDNAKDDKSAEEKNSKTIINDFSDLSEDFLKDFEDYAKAAADNHSQNEDFIKTLSIEKYDYFDRKVSEENLANAQKSGYELILVYELTNEQNTPEGFIPNTHRYCISKATNFEIVDGKIKADFSGEPLALNKNEMIAGFKLNGFGLAGREVFENKMAKMRTEVEASDAIDLKNKDDYDLANAIFGVNPEGTIKEGAAHNAPDIIKGADISLGSVETLYKKTDEQGNIWYFVETACEGDYKICGWISEKDLEHVDVGP